MELKKYKNIKFWKKKHVFRIIVVGTPKNSKNQKILKIQKIQTPYLD